MIRLAYHFSAVIALACMAAEVVGLGWSYQQGYLAEDKLTAAWTALQPEKPAEVEIEIPEELAQVAKEEVVERRAMAILELQARDRELQLLKSLVEQKMMRVTSAKQELEQMQTSFQSELDAATETLLSESAEQARGILLALQPDYAVEKLMTLEPDEAIRLMKGIPEKDHAKILEAFQGAERTERGNEIFRAIVRGRPESDIVAKAEETIQKTK